VRGARDRSSASDVNANLTEKPKPKPRPKPEHKPVLLSIWSVAEMHNIEKNIEYFGTDFEAIADHMGTKTGTMIKNMYLRLVEGGKQYLEHRAKEVGCNCTRCM
jgi:hypothetical protein